MIAKSGHSLFIVEDNAPAVPIRPGVGLPVYRECFYGEPFLGAFRRDISSYNQSRIKISKQKNPNFP
jgi:hypothetical protein